MALGSGADGGFWSTGNAWAAAGIVRVLGVYILAAGRIAAGRAGGPRAMSARDPERAGLLASTSRLLHPAPNAPLTALQDPQATLLHSYANDSSTFLDAASTMLVAASVHRHARREFAQLRRTARAARRRGQRERQRQQPPRRRRSCSRCGPGTATGAPRAVQRGVRRQA